MRVDSITRGWFTVMQLRGNGVVFHQGWSHQFLLLLYCNILGEKRSNGNGLKTYWHRHAFEVVCKNKEKQTKILCTDYNKPISRWMINFTIPFSPF